MRQLLYYGVVLLICAASPVAADNWEAGETVIVCPQTTIYATPAYDATPLRLYRDYTLVSLSGSPSVVDGETWWPAASEDATGLYSGYIAEGNARHCPNSPPPTGLRNPIIREQLQPGDIVLSRRDRATCNTWEFTCRAYDLYDARWMHTGIVAEANGALVVVEATQTFGVSALGASYAYINSGQQIAVLRVNAPESVRQAAADYALAQKRKPFSNVYAVKTRTDAFYCSQLVWAAYHHAGLNLDTDILLSDNAFRARYGDGGVLPTWITDLVQSVVLPDDFFHSDFVELIYLEERT